MLAPASCARPKIIYGKGIPWDLVVLKFQFVSTSLPKFYILVLNIIKKLKVLNECVYCGLSNFIMNFNSVVIIMYFNLLDGSVVCGRCFGIFNERMFSSHSHISFFF